MFIIELTTTTGTVCESFVTYEEAKRRVELFPAGGVASMPLIFEELPDGSQRLVREDGKPLQWHRLPEDGPPGPDTPLPVCEESSDLLGEVRVSFAQPESLEGEWDDEPLRLEGGT